MHLADRISQPLFEFVEEHQAFRRVVQRVAAAYISRFRGWKPTRRERALIREAVRRDLHVEFVDTSRRPLRLGALVKGSFRFNRKAKPCLLHPDGTTDEQALKTLESAVVSVREKGPFLYLDRKTIKGGSDGSFYIFDLRRPK